MYLGNYNYLNLNNSRWPAPIQKMQILLQFCPIFTDILLKTGMAVAESH